MNYFFAIKFFIINKKFNMKIEFELDINEVLNYSSIIIIIITILLIVRIVYIVKINKKNPLDKNEENKRLLKKNKIQIIFRDFNKIPLGKDFFDWKNPYRMKIDKNINQDSIESESEIENEIENNTIKSEVKINKNYLDFFVFNRSCNFINIGEIEKELKKCRYKSQKIKNEESNFFDEIFYVDNLKFSLKYKLYCEKTEDKKEKNNKYFYDSFTQEILDNIPADAKHVTNENIKNFLNILIKIFGKYPCEIINLRTLFGLKKILKIIKKHKGLNMKNVEISTLEENIIDEYVTI